MRCKKHAAVDLSSSVGVCATCLRERLTAIIEAQTRAQLHAHLSRLHGVVAPEDPIKQPDPNHPPPPLVFPRSVSPYVSRRKSAADDSCLPPPSTHHHHYQHHIRFYSTPQVGPTFAVDGGCYRKSKPRFSLLTSLFRSRSDKFWAGSSSRVDPIHPERSPSSWISAIFAGKRGRRKTKQCIVEESATVVQVRSRHMRARGMSPDFSHEDCDPSASGSGDSTTPEWKRTPVQATPSRKNRSGPAVMKNVSGLTFCLSPLVRANPNPQWNPKVMQGGFSTELGGFTGEIRVAAAKPHLSSAASFSMNRSRKLADFGRATSYR